MSFIKRFYIYLLFFFVKISLTAVPLSSLIDRPEEDYPLSNTVVWDSSTVPELDYLPDVPGAQALRERFYQFQPEITVQRFYKKPLPAQFSGATSEERKNFFTAIVNALGRPDSQVGYTYFSTSRDRDTVLFKESYISDVKGRRIDGFEFTRQDLPAKISYYQYINEVNFSGGVFSQTITVEDTFVSYQSINMEKLWYKIFPIIGEEDIRNDLFVFISGDYYYIYNCTQVAKEPAAKKIGLPIHISIMVKKRMDVMVKWLEDSLPQ